ncbi:phosphoglycerate kinase [Desulfofundulus thermosubterraneus]|uniref:Phosphoglycerate kinase n=1 Tax=Desulfofundulus thermosubterraneus DSM 16057 TaxID=1121432 RepID=A0A1M6C497_9FIRM|nr:phosphoglycerate kinase [Desulfofundulus thermosubterraneus]SHI55885.1 phosphoglycerate kinase [Desulfofundulus thermosubterraneus DSM 16057]
MIKTIRDLEVTGKRVLVRVDFNVPLDQEGNVADDTRIRAALPTIQYLIDRQARVILASHLGRPKGKVDDRYRLDPVARRLSELLGKPVVKVDDCVGDEPRQAIDGMQPGDVVLLENVRFYPGEEKNDEKFARQLAELADVYVNDAFGTAHRAHASTEGVAHFLPAAAGFLMEKEITVLSQALSNPTRPFVAILGGAKVSDKIGVIENLLGKVDALLIGGGMANTFLAARGFALGKSLLEADRVALARDLMARAEKAGVKLLLPVDLVVAEAARPEAEPRVVPVDSVPEEWMALDIGPKTVETFAAEVHDAGTVIWNGPMGVFEMAPFAAGTFGLAKALADSKATTIVGGGDTAAAVEKAGVAGRMSHISTGGGASLEFLEGKVLPGVAVLMDTGK